MGVSIRASAHSQNKVTCECLTAGIPPSYDKSCQRKDGVAVFGAELSTHNTPGDSRTRPHVRHAPRVHFSTGASRYMRICRATYLHAVDTTNPIVMAPHEADASAPAAADKPLDIRIRSYTAADHAVVRDLFIDGMHYYCPPGHNEGLRNYVQRSLKEDMADIEGTYFASGGHFWVATTTDKNGDEIIIGSIAIEGKEDNRGELRRLSVRSDYRRHGLARKLVAHLENWATQQGKSAVFLNTGWEMVPAIKLYDALGYTLTHKHVFREEPYAALFFYEKKLAPTV